MLRKQYQPDIHESVHGDIIVKVTNKMQLVNGKLVAVLLAVVGQHHCYHHVPTVNQRLLLQLTGS
jgi:hypothetical protein